MATVGDGGEYIAYAITLSHGEVPPLSSAAIARFRADIEPFDPALVSWPLEDQGRRTADGEVEFVHFWLYPSLAAPGVAVMRLLGLDPRHAFTLLNIGLLAAGFLLVVRSVGVSAGVLLFLSPIVWWVNKAHPEPFILSLTAIAFAQWRQRPAVAVACAGLVAAQVAPFAILVPALAIGAAVSRPAVLRGRAFAAGVVAGVLLAAWPALHYLAAFGRVSLVADLIAPHWPSRAEFGVTLLDLNLGLVANWPLLAAVVVLAVVGVARREPRSLLRADVVASVVAAAVLLLSFAQIGNFVHGATPGIIRYAMWLAPLAIPLIAASQEKGSARTLAFAAAASACLSVVAYRPSVAEFAHRPTWIATWVWGHAPNWSRPLPRVFMGSLDPHRVTGPVAPEGCGKILLMGRGESQGMWPRPCPPAPVPAFCSEPGVLCYANRSGRKYTFHRLDDTVDWLKYDPASVWPKAAEPAIRIAMSHVDWWSMAPRDPRRLDASIARVEGATIEYLYVSNDAVFMTVRDVTDGARLVLAPGWRASLTDGETGRVVQPAEASELPAGFRVLIVGVERF